MAISGRRRVGLVIVVAALAVAAIGVVAVRADPAPNLPPIAGDQLLASSLAALARPFTISGEVDTRFDLGIPQIPSSVGGAAGGGALNALALATGDQRYKVWRSADGVRIAHLLDLSEQDLVVSTSDAWFWDSSDMSAVHFGVPGMTLGQAVPGAAALHDADFLTFAQRALGALAPFADVSVDTTSLVAGRPAYDLVLTPTSTLTLIGRVDVAIDAETRLPLRFQVFPRGSDAAAIEAGFTIGVLRADRPVDVLVHTATGNDRASGRGCDRASARGGGERRGAARFGSTRVRPRLRSPRRGAARRAPPGRGAARSFRTRDRWSRPSRSSVAGRRGCSSDP